MLVSTTLNSTKLLCHKVQLPAILLRQVVATHKEHGLVRYAEKTVKHLWSGPVRNVATFFKDEQAPEISGAPQTLKQSGLQSKRTILLALDTATESDACVEWAMENLLRAGDEAHVVHLAPGANMEHVFRVPVGQALQTTTRGMAAMDDLLEGVYTARARELCDRLGPRLGEARVDLHVHVLPLAGGSSKSHIGTALCDQAEELGAEAVVVTTHSHGGLSELIKGSVAHHVVHNCSKSVIVLHDSIKEPAPPVSTRRPSGQWRTVSHSGPDSAGMVSSAGAVAAGRQLLLAVDSTDDSLAACRWVLGNMYRKGDTLRLVHVVPCLPSLGNISGSDLIMDASVGFMNTQANADLAFQQRKMAMQEAEEWQRVQAAATGSDPRTQTPHPPNPTTKNPEEEDPVFKAVQEVANAAAEDEAREKGVFSATNPAAQPEEEEDRGLDAIRAVAEAAAAEEEAKKGPPPTVSAGRSGGIFNPVLNAIKGVTKAASEHEVEKRGAPPAMVTGSGGMAAAPQKAAGAATSTPPPASSRKSVQAQAYRDLINQYGAHCCFDILVEYTENPVDTISSAICGRAVEMGAAAVVLSYRHHAPLVEFVMGSVTNQVSHHCHSPVVVLRGLESM